MKAVRKLLPFLILPWILGGQSLYLKKQIIKPVAGSVAMLEAPGPRWTTGRSHLILQFRHAVNDRMVRELNQRGAFVVGAVPDFGVTVSALDGFSLEGLDVAWAGRLDAGHKISPLLEHLNEAEGWFVVEFFPDVDMEDARRMAEAYGFDLHRHPDLIRSHLLLSGDPNRLRGLAQWDEVAYIFPASRNLIRGEHVHHCAGALTTGGVTGSFTGPGSGWAPDAAVGVTGSRVTLFYVFGALTPKLESSQVTQAILQALNSWTPYAPVKFVAGESATAPRTIYIWFAAYDHGDGYPFDGPGGILAHTFYPAPVNAEPIAGDMHFDGSENWHIGANTDLFTVALHEAGHVLGLAHVDTPAALMYPYYTVGERITPTDISNVQALYQVAGSTAADSAVPPLTLTITAPTANTTTASATIAVSGTTSGAGGNVPVTWQTNQGRSGTAIGSTPWTIAAVPLTVGSNTITVTAADASRKAVETVTVTRLAPPAATVAAPDSTPPTITITSPTGTTVNTSSATITLAGHASDNVGVTRVTWQSAGYSGTAAGTTTWTASSLPLLLGNNIVDVWAHDAAGNQASKCILVVRK